MKKFDEKVVRCALNVFFTATTVDLVMRQIEEDQIEEDQIEEDMVIRRVNNMHIYVLIHNLIMQAKATISNSVETFTYQEIASLIRSIDVLMEEYDETLTDYQMKKLKEMSESLYD